MANSSKPRLVGFNHVAIEVGDIQDALDFYGKLFSFELRSREPGMAFIDLGDQFLALQETTNPSPAGGRHFGLVVEDKEAARQRIVEAGVTVEIIGYANIQFTKADHVLRGMGLSHLSKNDEAIRELTEKGMAPPKEVQTA